MTPEVERMRIRLDRSRTGSNAHTVNKAMMYLAESDKQQSVTTRAKLLAACEHYLTTNDLTQLDKLMKGWW